MLLSSNLPVERGELSGGSAVGLWMWAGLTPLDGNRRREPESL